MTDDELAVASGPPSTDVSAVPEQRGIDPDDTTVVPAALTALVTAAHATYQVMQANGCYPPVMALGAVEDTVATMHRISYDLRLYVGDFSTAGAAGVRRAADLLRQAQSALSSARHSLVLDEMADPADRLVMSGPTTESA